MMLKEYSSSTNKSGAATKNIKTHADFAVRMDDVSLHILDLAMNSVRAGAENISIFIEETGETLAFTVSDDGCGMTDEQTRMVGNTRFTTKPSKNAGRGMLSLKAAAERAGGEMAVSSKNSEEYARHGTEVTARFFKKYPGCIPVGNMAETLMSIVQAAPEARIIFRHVYGQRRVCFDSEKLKAYLGGIMPASEYGVLLWIRDFLRKQYENN